MSNSAIAVRQLNTYVKTLLESDSKLSYISVKGEISNFKSHFSSGHWYFVLKDSEASVKCMMFSSSTKTVKFLPKDGMTVTIRGRISLYEKDGQYQFYAEEMLSDGEGDMAAEFLRLKERLQKEGLFNQESKRPIKKFPKRIAVVTSGSGAALEDIKNVLNRRYPICEIIVCSASVQGLSAATDLMTVLDRVYNLEDIDTVIIGRGGGSTEDLSVFNDEGLVRKIYESPFPVISAVGHETNFTLCDFVADLRAPTPSAAAEIAVPDIKNISYTIFKHKKGISHLLITKYRLSASEYYSFSKNLTSLNPKNKIEGYSDKINLVTKSLVNAFERKIYLKNLSLSKNSAKLDALSPLKTLSRGFAVAEFNGKIVKSVDDISRNSKISIKLNDGSAECTVDSTTKKV